MSQTKQNGKTALDYAIEQNKLSAVLLLLPYTEINNFEKIYNLLSSQDQNDPCVMECLQILSIVPVVPSPIQDNQDNKNYLKKLTTLHHAYKILFSHVIDESTGIPFPFGIGFLMLDYDGRFFKPAAPSIKFFDIDTVNPHLIELKKEIVKKAKPGLFTQIIQEIDDAIELKRQNDAIALETQVEKVVVNPEAASSSLSRSQVSISRNKCVVM